MATIMRAADHHPLLDQSAHPQLCLADHPAREWPGAAGRERAAWPFTGPVQLLYNDIAVAIGLIYSFLPFMILPIYATLEKLRLAPAGSGATTSVPTAGAR